MKKILFITLLITSLRGYSQRIQNFNTFVAGNSVGIRFTVVKGPQCSGYTIYHSIDSVNFIQVYNFTGVVGDQNANQDISYTHSSPALNQVNYYKVELIPVETTPVNRIYVSNQPKIKMLVYPNPVVYNYDVLSMKLFNVSNIRVIGFLYNQFGKPLKQIDVTTVKDTGIMNVYDLSNGLYVLWLTDGTQVYSAKFIVNR